MRSASHRRMMSQRRMYFGTSCCIYRLCEPRHTESHPLHRARHQQKLSVRVLCPRPYTVCQGRGGRLVGRCGIRMRMRPTWTAFDRLWLVQNSYLIMTWRLTSVHDLGEANKQPETTHRLSLGSVCRVDAALLNSTTAHVAVNFDRSTVSLRRPRIILHECAFSGEKESCVCVCVCVWGYCNWKTAN